MNIFDRIVRSTLSGGVPLTIFLLAIVAGIAALQFTPREEEPQIVVPMVDVLIEAPGLSAKQVERQVATPVEKLLAQIPGVEHVYSTSTSGKASVTLRFFVGEDREISILNTYNKLYANQDKVPGVVSNWMLRPIEVDDVPIILLALWSDSPDRYGDYELRRLAEDVSTYLQGIELTSEVNVVGGRPRTIRILIDPESMGARKTTAADIFNAMQVSNVLRVVDQWAFNNESIVLESGDFLRTVGELNSFVVNVIDGIPVYLGDIAEIIDGPAEPDYYTWLDFAPGHPSFQAANDGYPMVSISVAKQRGSNAVAVAENVHELMARLQREVFPEEIHVEVIRDYGKTADEKVNNLTSSLGFAVFTVVVFIGVFLGWRQALVVGLAVPICYGVSLALDLAFGYTINRVTLFALILSLACCGLVTAQDGGGDGGGGDGGGGDGGGGGGDNPPGTDDVLVLGDIPQAGVHVDANGVLNVRAVEKRSEKQASIQIVPNHGLTREEVQQMENDSYAHAAQDMAAHRLIDLRNQARLDIRAIEKQLAKVGDEMDADYRAEVQQRVAEVKAMAEASDVDLDQFHEALDAMDKSTVRLAELAITMTLREESDG